MSWFKRTPIYIYGLRRLDSDRYVYIGQSRTFKAEKRLLYHIKSARDGTHSNKRLALWIKKILDCKCSTIVCDILEVVPEYKANERELHWIRYYNQYRPKLFNIMNPMNKYERL